MKALFVTGGDFAALHFADEFRGTSVSHIIEHLDRYYSEASMIEGAEDIYLEAVEAGTINPLFLENIRAMRDYDDRKQSYFWMEDEEIKF